MTLTPITEPMVDERTAAIFTDLSCPIHEGHIKSRKQGNRVVDFVPWHCLARHLHHRCPMGWDWGLDEVREMGGWVLVRGTLTIRTPDGPFTYSAVSSEPLNNPDHKGAPPIETAASRALARAAALAGLGIHLWETPAK